MFFRTPYCYYYQTDKRIASLGWDLFTRGSEVMQASEVPPSVALWLMERLFIGRGRYTEVKQLLLRYKLNIGILNKYKL